jgi:hypothetical protein
VHCFIPHFEALQMAFKTRYRTLKSVGRNPSYKQTSLFFGPPCIYTIYYILYMSHVSNEICQLRADIMWALSQPPHMSAMRKRIGRSKQTKKRSNWAHFFLFLCISGQYIIFVGFSAITMKICKLYSKTIYILVALSMLCRMTLVAFQNSYPTKSYNRKTKTAYSLQLCLAFNFHNLVKLSNFNMR